MRGIIRVGDSTSHGGRVETGSDMSDVMGRAVARRGDRCSCPIAGHESSVIAEGDPDFIVDGKPAAFDGHKTSCGAMLISSLSSSGRT
ncbi:PAAR domain-containing protein [Trinickia sp. EG282A]|uniref:PAAR domain-containing protein n=1 Tax=Trinickia sp. EG282A TaxID=3237013 RepID=UPI0034D30F77